MSGNQRIAAREISSVPETPVSLARVSILDAKHKFTREEMRAGMIARGLLARQTNGAAQDGHH